MAGSIEDKGMVKRIEPRPILPPAPLVARVRAGEALNLATRLEIFLQPNPGPISWEWSVWLEAGAVVTSCHPDVTIGQRAAVPVSVFSEEGRTPRGASRPVHVSVDVQFAVKMEESLAASRVNVYAMLPRLNDLARSVDAYPFQRWRGRYLVAPEVGRDPERRLYFVVAQLRAARWRWRW